MRSLAIQPLSHWLWASIEALSKSRCTDLSLAIEHIYHWLKIEMANLLLYYNLQDNKYEDSYRDQHIGVCLSWMLNLPTRVTSWFGMSVQLSKKNELYIVDYSSNRLLSSLQSPHVACCIFFCGTLLSFLHCSDVLKYDVPTRVTSPARLQENIHLFSCWNLVLFQHEHCFYDEPWKLHGWPYCLGACLLATQHTLQYSNYIEELDSRRMVKEDNIRSLSPTTLLRYENPYHRYEYGILVVR